MWGVDEKLKAQIQVRLLALCLTMTKFPFFAGYPRSYALNPYVVLTSACGGSGHLDFGCKHLEMVVRALFNKFIR